MLSCLHTMYEYNYRVVCVDAVEHVQRVAEGASAGLPPGARHVALHPLARRHGLRLLLRVVRAAAARGAAARRALVPAQPQRPRLQPHPRDDSLARAPTRQARHQRSGTFVCRDVTAAKYSQIFDLRYLIFMFAKMCST